VLYPLVDPPAAWVVLALPAFGVSTKEAYEWFDDRSVAVGSSSASLDSLPALADASTFGGAPQGELGPVVPQLARDDPEPGRRVEGSRASRSRARPSAKFRSTLSLSKGRTLVWPQAPPEAELRNDLQCPVAERHPQIGRLVGALRRLGASYAAMSGSGSAVFGLFATRASAALAAAALGARTRRTMVTRTLNRAKYQALARPR
jgi:4-diphosphocytidyl-2-C-methyl-D-erythritol kinase